MSIINVRLLCNIFFHIESVLCEENACKRTHNFVKGKLQSEWLLKSSLSIKAVTSTKNYAQNITSKIKF